MKNNKVFHFLIIGFLAGILFSGLLLIVIIDIKTLETVESYSTIVQDTSTKAIMTINIEEKININTADQDLLDSLPGIGPQKAAAIITFRQKYGSFENINELLYVPGISDNLYNSIKAKIYINN